MRKDDRVGIVPEVSGIRVGTLLGKCLLTELLGRGGCCTVYRALHQTLHIPVAVKILHSQTGIASHRSYEPLRTEARLLAQLDHPHIVRALDFEDDPALPYLVLECVEGPSLGDSIAQSGRLSLERACEVIGQTADALAALWKLRAVHRDVKPGNILLTRDGTAKLADLGQAIFLDEPQGAADGPRDEVAGTAAYLAPEQFLTPATVDHRADIYALGATFYQAVTGRLAFSGKSFMEVLLKHARQTPPPPHELVPDLPPLVSEVILTMMAKSPADRYQNIDELETALSKLSPAESPPITEMPAPSVAETIVQTARAEPRRSVWQSLRARLVRTPAPAPDDWLHVVKRSLAASTRKTMTTKSENI